MSRKTKKQSATGLAGAVFKAAVGCTLIVLCCVGSVWQKKRIDELSQQIRAGEKRLKQARSDNDKLRGQLAELFSPGAIEFRVKQLNLGLAQPLQTQILRLPEPAQAPPPAQHAAAAGGPPAAHPDRVLAVR